MNNSLCISDLSPSSSGRRDDDASDESSWTMYLEDFFANHVHDNHDSSTLNDKSCSVVSDAASSVGKKSLHSEPVVESFSTDQKSCNRFSFKKRRTKEAFVDDALEDTASSPARSSKVYDLNNQFNNKSRKLPWASPKRRTMLHARDKRHVIWDLLAMKMTLRN
ncbi:hypothetical protein K2173_003088 [Erythroxylum novogranatense]|uniref:Uncharacterized protein n=1 Tax=Erythroxylum novogranatense TaxID=1862640 RepID=A0AAV8T9X4_9ROSI|nr:hypothetical protein K2173_003088 [Erythroxylum novogranatense]